MSADRDADAASRRLKRRAVSMTSAMAMGTASVKTLPLVAMARPKAAPAAANFTALPSLAAVTQASKQSATKKVSQLSVVKKWASWIDIGASAAKSAAIRPTVRPAERGTERGDGEYGERAQGGGDGPSHEVGAVHGIPIGAGESGKRPGGRVGHPEREGTVGELAELAGGWVGRARIQATARGIEERTEIGWPLESDAIDQDDLGDEELVGVQIGAVIPIDAVEAQRQSRQEDDRERHGPDVERR